ncbi:hypothetical protein [Flavobacterium sp. 1355]|uniref:hypothetical protein n=1 Tax=Flavobacterium sp. 1355 TaxID=2806571 RepID=UPI001AE4E515|nr:hypothetical protein [Flavobacterium sp. 1355]MBP1222355.1 hypothetical protein [Flavobacterium sp. 1355]
MNHNHQHLELNGKRIFICERHHHVLKFWSEFKLLNPYLLSFDHHTDTNKAFQHYIHHNRHPEQSFEIQQFDLLSGIIENDVIAINKLTHAEHIDAAIKTGIIKKALIYSEDNIYGKPEIYTINGDENYNGQLIIINNNYEDPAVVISTETLESNFRKFDLCISREDWIDNFILDIDLDFFKSTKAFVHSNLSFLKQLIDKSIAISIATEPIFIKSWQAQYDNSLSVEYLLEKIIELIDS